MNDAMDTVVSTTAAFRAAIGAEAERIEEDSRYASKSHYNDASSWNRLHLSLGVVATLLAAAAGATGLLADSPVLAAIISFLSAGATAVLTFQKPAERASSHQLAGAGYAAVLRRARQLRTIDVVGSAADDELRRALDEIGADEGALDKEAPVVSARAFRTARKGIEEGEASHVVDRRKGG
jgi:hypothetical protein